ncbi:MAG: IniB N-terminal domain-containing protein [Pseudonocardia sp.]|nr:IniB N-terminal domain-containing protein [Pseudonocardia sp.]
MALSLIEFIRQLLSDAGLREQFEADPQATLDANGLGDVSAEDLHDSLVLVRDESDHDSGGGYGGGNYIAAPQPAHHDQSPVEYLQTYITNNYTIDDRDIDNSVNQVVDNRGGVFEQDIDNVSNSGDGAVVAGDDIDDSTITTGDGNQVGDGNVAGSGNVVGDDNNAVTGDGNTTGFGSGDVSSVGGDVSVGAGGAFSGTGNATVDNSDNSVEDSGNTTTTTTFDDSFNQDNDTTTSDDDSFTATVEDDHSTSTHTESSVEGSFNTA